jgi:hypothetical protein
VVHDETVSLPLRLRCTESRFSVTLRAGVAILAFHDLG